MVDFLFALIELFRYYGSGVMMQNVYSWAVFTGVDLFALKFYLDTRNLETLSYYRW